MTRTGSARGGRAWTAGALAAGLGVRLFYAYGVRTHDSLGGDADHYHYQASALLHGRWFVNPYVVAAHGPSADVASAAHPPLFTVVLALGDLVGLGSLHAEKALMCAIGVVTIGTVAVLARRLAGRRAGVVAAWVAALYPGLWIFDAEVMSEALTVLLAALTVLVAMRVARRPTWPAAAGLGAMCALCAPPARS